MKGEDRFIPFVSLLLIFIALIIFLFLSRPGGSELQTCGKSLCANDIYSGQKTCPASGSQVTFNPSFQTCNPPNGCDPSSEAPCKYVSKDVGTVCPGDVNYNSGVCKADVSSADCKCTSRKYCPDFATVYFKIDNVSDSTLRGPCTNLIVFVQETTWRDAANLPRNDMPISPGLALDSTTVCGVTKEQLKNVWPPNTCLRGSLILNKPDSKYYCANVPSTVKCKTGEIAVRQSNNTFVCEKDSAGAQFNG